MNLEEAKLIVQCRRPGGQDDRDVAISEALTLVRNDQTASERMRQEEALDAMIGERLRSMDPPGDLLRKILVGRSVTRRRHWWQRPVWLAAAAAVAVGVPVALNHLPDTPQGGPVFAAISLADFRAASTQRLNDGPRVRPLPTYEEVKAHLAEHSRARSVPVPDNLCHAPGGTVGCEIFEWRGREVTLICFNAGKAGTVHLFTVDASALEDGPGGPIYQPSNGWQTRAWIEDGRLMVLAANEKDATREDIEVMVRD
jgi:hypothetical protein